ncbi:MAG: phenylalanine--tRNA ligase subunit beta [candidate division KSB1 bacterium]|nr:phenylalanine--tRNA ligase subunit beta [candidate division KSB1 bacterium]
MKVTVDWLKKYIDFDYDPQELAYHMTMTGLEVDGIENIDYTFEGVVIGEIVKVHRNAKSDRLTICDVNVGNEVLRLVCGAPNVAAGLKVPVAPAGSKMPDGTIIQTATIRGQESPGMICSEKELGVSQRSDIIMEVPDDAETGKDFKEFLSSGETVIEIDLTPNRPDCLGMIGIAREIGALNGSTLQLPVVNVPEYDDKMIEDHVKVIIENPENCPRYSARYMDGVKIGPSPLWLVKKIEAIGIRSINNVVDVTNFVMMETGQPLHAFDYDYIEKGTIVVQNASKGQKFTTLDEKEHSLSDETCMICDAEKAVALAGIMGGLNSEVSEKTSRILLESAYFNPANIRKSSKFMGISTDSSQRFERGVDPNGTIYALDRAAQLIAELAGGKAAKGVVDVYPEEITAGEVTLQIDKVKRVLGDEIGVEKMCDILDSLELKTRLNQNRIEVTVPTYRPDIKIEEDLIEEIARIYGYNNIKENTSATISLSNTHNEGEKFANAIGDASVELGYYEVLTNTLMKPELTSLFSSHEPVGLLNPLSEDMSVLRTSMIPGLLLVAQHNINRKNKDLKLYESGHVFHWTVRKKEEHCEESKVVYLVTGSTFEKNWLDNSRPVQFHDIKGDMESLLVRLGVDNFSHCEVDLPFLDDRRLGIEVNRETIGYLGAIHKNVLKKFELEDDVFIAQFDMQTLMNGRKTDKRFTPIPKFPAINRDLSLLLDASVPAADVESVIQESAGEYLRALRLYDLYKGKQISADKKSLTFALVFYAEDRTLTEAEIDQNMKDVIETLKKRLNAQLRA